MAAGHSPAANLSPIDSPSPSHSRALILAESVEVVCGAEGRDGRSACVSHVEACVCMRRREASFFYKSLCMLCYTPTSIIMNTIVLTIIFVI